MNHLYSSFHPLFLNHWIVRSLMRIMFSEEERESTLRRILFPSSLNTFLHSIINNVFHLQHCFSLELDNSTSCFLIFKNRSPERWNTICSSWSWSDKIVFWEMKFVQSKTTLLIVLNREILHHPDANFSIQAATSYNACNKSNFYSTVSWPMFPCCWQVTSGCTNINRSWLNDSDLSINRGWCPGTLRYVISFVISSMPWLLFEHLKASTERNSLTSSLKNVCDTNVYK